MILMRSAIATRKLWKSHAKTETIHHVLRIMWFAESNNGRRSRWRKFQTIRRVSRSAFVVTAQLIASA